MKKILLLLLVSTLLFQLAYAGTISITTTARTSTFLDGKGNITFKIVNSGDEDAHNVIISVISSAFSVEDINTDVLKSNSSFEKIVNLDLSDGFLSGTYSDFIIIKYQDANGYQFSAVSPLVWNNQKSSEAKISGNFYPLTLEGDNEKTMTLELSNNDNIAHEILVRFVVPNDLTVKSPEKTLLIGPGETKKITFKISNLSGLDGSRYAILGLVEYEDSTHFSTLINGFVTIKEAAITEEKNVSKFNIIFITVILIGSIFMIIYYFFGKHIKLQTKKK